MQGTRNQGEYTVNDLYRKGYTVAAAARIVGCSTQHLSAVLKGERRSSRLMQEVGKLPVRKLVLREKHEKEVAR